MLSDAIEIASAQEEPALLGPAASSSVSSGPLQQQPPTISAKLRDGFVLQASRAAVTSHARLPPPPTVSAEATVVPTVPVAAPAAAGWAWASNKFTVTALEADTDCRRVVVVGSRSQPGRPEAALGAVAILDAKGAFRHSLEIASPVMSAALGQSSLLLGCRDGSVRLVDYTVHVAPPESCVQPTRGGLALLVRPSREMWAALGHTIAGHLIALIAAMCLGYYYAYWRSH